MHDHGVMYSCICMYVCLCLCMYVCMYVWLYCFIIVVVIIIIIIIVILILTFVITMYDCHANENQDEWTALILASAKGHKDVVKLLTDKGAKLDIQDKVSIELVHA